MIITKNEKKINRVLLLPFSIILALCSITRIPIYDELSEVKIFLFAMQLVGVAILLLFTRIDGDLFNYFIICFAALLIKDSYGLAVSTISYDQWWLESLSELRFGIFICFTPLIFRFLKETLLQDLIRLACLVCICILFEDLLAFEFLNQDFDLITLGVRSDNRFVVSIVSVIGLLIVIWIRGKDNGLSIPTLLFVLIIFAASHAYLVSTSRTETMLSLCLLLAFTLDKWIAINWFFPFFVVLTILYFLENDVNNSLTSGSGRDYLSAFSLILDVMPFGVGSLTDKISKLKLQMPEDFYISDYGILSYLIRYGMFGFIIIIYSIAVILKIFRVIYNVRGGLFVSGSILLYFCVVPVVDYAGISSTVFVASSIWVGRHSLLVSKK